MINCIVVDDEPLARQLLKSYISRISYLSCVQVCQSAVEAFAALHHQKIDLIFLDIEMPGITGINFLESLKISPKIIFTTAYSDYAVDAFDIEAVDYLLKPITFERFNKAVQKLGTINSGTPPEKNQQELNQYIFLKVDRRLVKIAFAAIIYIEGYGDYLKVHTQERIYIIYMTLSRLEKLLPPVKFIRIHRSTIINKDFMEFIEGNMVKVNHTDLAIGQTYRESLLKSLG